jgi:hypothetical protein
MAAASIAWRTEAPLAGRQQAEALRAFARAGGLDRGVLATPRPRVGARAPRRTRGGIATQEQGLAFLRATEHLRPGRGAPRLALRCITMRGEAGRLVQAPAQGLPPRREGADVGEAPAAVVNPRLEHG